MSLYPSLVYIVRAIIAVYPILFIPYAFFDVSAYIVISPLLAFLFISSFTSFSFSNLSFFRLRLLGFNVLMCSILFIEQGGFSPLFILSYAAILVFSPVSSSRLFNITQNFSILIVLLSLAAYSFYIFGVPPLLSFTNDERTYYSFIFTVSDYSSFNLFEPNSWRFYGPFNEPGSLASFLFTMLLTVSNLFIKRCILILELLTFSSGFFGAFLFYILFDYLPLVLKQFLALRFSKLLIIGSILVVVLLFLASKSSYLSYKIFLADQSVDELVMVRQDLSFFRYLLDSNYLGIFVYSLAVLLAPRRFWLLLFLTGLYRFHFVFNSLTYLTSIFLVYENSHKSPFSILSGLPNMKVPKKDNFSRLDNFKRTG